MLVTGNKSCLIVPILDPETALMLRVQRDEAGAFEELAARLSPRLLGRFLRLLHDRQDAEDLTQEALWRLYRHRKRYQPRARFATWLYHITQNLARNAIRARRRHARLQFTPLEGGEDMCREQETRASEPAMPAERRELAGIVRGAVRGLADRQRLALEMRQFQHRSYAEIAAALSLTAKATKSLLYRARLQLRCFLIHWADV